MDKIENMVEVLPTNIHKITFVLIKNLARTNGFKGSLCKAEQIRP